MNGDSGLRAEAKSLLGVNLSFDKPLAPLTTFRVGGTASYYFIADTFHELKTAHTFFKEHAIPFFILGKGSNMLVSDKGYQGAVIRLGADFRKINAEEGTVTAGADVPLSQLLRVCLQSAFKGFSWAVGIPGSIGGAVITNAGTGKKDISQNLNKVTFYDFEAGLKNFKRGEIKFGYRSCSLKGKGAVLEAELGFETGVPAEIAAEMEENFKMRKDTQPMGYSNAGCIFKNPKEAPAGRLIDEAGCKGMEIGGAYVAREHANFILNSGSATAADIYNLIKRIQAEVIAKSGIWLDLEIEMLGEF